MASLGDHFTSFLRQAGCDAMKWAYWGAMVVLIVWAYGPALPASDAELRAAYFGRRVVVCGSSYGIGADIAHDFCNAGARVCVRSLTYLFTYLLTYLLSLSLIVVPHLPYSLTLYLGHRSCWWPGPRKN